MRCLDGITDLMDLSLSELQELVIGKPGVLQSMGLQRDGHYQVTELSGKMVWKTPKELLANPKTL